MSYIDTNAILTQLQTKLLAVTLPTAWKTPAEDAFAAGAVKVFDMQNLELALQELLVFEDRACFIVFQSWEYEPRTAGRVAYTSRQMELVLLMTDRDFGSRNNALVGDADNPGVLRIADAVVAAIGGDINDSSSPAMLFTRGTGETFTITGEERDNLTGRAGFVQTYVVHGGESRENLGRVTP
jgi:hypothetical protein